MFLKHNLFLKVSKTAKSFSFVVIMNENCDFCVGFVSVIFNKEYSSEITLVM